MDDEAELLAIAEALAVLEFNDLDYGLPGSNLSGRDIASFTRLRLEAKSILDEALGPINNFSMSLSFTSGSSLIAVQECRGVIEGAVNHLRRHPAKTKPAREKQQKFRILDAPSLLLSDLSREPGVLGRAVIYVDLDNFKAVNQRLTETVVDRLILPRIHRLLADYTSGLGYAYGEGGDEFTVLLPNASQEIALAFSEALRVAIESVRFEGARSEVQLSASIGIAHQRRGAAGNDLPERANRAKNHAKESGKNCVAVEINADCQVVARAQ